MNSDNEERILYNQDNIKISLIYNQQLEHGTTYYFHISIIKDQKLLNQEIEPFEFHPKLNELLGHKETEKIWKIIKPEIIKILDIKTGNLTKLTIDKNKKLFKIIEYPKCALCQEPKELKKSHIIPKFISKWIKNTSQTGKFRDLDYRRVQDSTKLFLLCGDCEEKLSKFEKYFAEKIFHPTVNLTSTDVKYDIKLLNFVISISWRILKVIINIKDENSEDIPKKLLEIENIWRKFLDGKISNASTSHYLIHTVCILNFMKDFQKSWKNFTERAIGYGYDDYNDVDFIWSQIPYYFIISPLKPTSLSGYEQCLIRENGLYREFCAINTEKFDFIGFIFSKLDQFNKEIQESKSS